MVGGHPQILDVNRPHPPLGIGHFRDIGDLFQAVVPEAPAPLRGCGAGCSRRAPPLGPALI